MDNSFACITFCYSPIMEPFIFTVFDGRSIQTDLAWNNLRQLKSTNSSAL